MDFGLKSEDLEYIIGVIKKIPQIDKAMIFGSRAKGTEKNGSDVDMAISGNDVTFEVVSKLHSMLEDEGPMPYFFDVVDYTHLTHRELKEHIDRVGKTIYEK